MTKLGSSWLAKISLVACLGAASSAHAVWTFGSATPVADTGSTGINLIGQTGAYAANGGTLPSGALNTSIVAAGTVCATSICGSASGNANTYGISGFSATTWTAGNTAANLQYYSGLGLGMASDSTLGTSPNHALDNGPSTNGSDLISGLGNTESIMLSFSSSVVLTSIGVGWKQGDADISLFRYTGASAPSMSGVATSSSGMASAGWSLVGNYGDLAVDTSNPYNLVNAGNLGSTWWLISAYNSSYGAATTGTVDQGNDFFKMYAVAGTACTGSVATCGQTTNVQGAPEPGSLALASLAVVGVFASRRKILAKRQTA